MSSSFLPLGTIVTLTTTEGEISLGMVVGVWSLGSANEFCDHVGRSPTHVHGELGYILLLNTAGKTVRVFYGDPTIGKIKRET